MGVSLGGMSGGGGVVWTDFEGGEIVWLEGRDVLGNVLDRSGPVRRRLGGWVITAADVNVENVRSAVKENSLNGSILSRQRVATCALSKHRRSGGHGTICTKTTGEGCG